MKKYINILTTIIFTLSIISSCTKPGYEELEQTNCTNEYSQHEHNQKYQEIIDEYCFNGITGMTVVISKSNDDIWMGSAGYSSIEENQKMNNCNLYQTASLAKSFIGILTLQMIDENKLTFDSKIENHLSDNILDLIPNSEQITIKHLIQQTSGLPDIFELDFISDFMNKPEYSYTRLELLNYIKNKKALSNPGEEHYYADTNFILLSLIIDNIEGSHIDAMQTRIFDKLNLTSSFYHTGNYPNIKALPQSYWDQYNSGNIENISILQKRVSEFIIGSDGIISSPMDMINFYKNVFESDLISSSLKESLINDLVTESNEFKMNTSYSHGFMLIEKEGERWIGHAGSQLGTSCFVFYNLETKDCIGAFTNIGTFLFEEKTILIFSELWEDLKLAIQ